MGNALRWFMPGLMYEVTTRTIQERYLLTPSANARELILGVLGRGLALYPAVRLHAFAYLSNHCHLLVSASDGQSLAFFLGYVNSNVAREMGRLHRWRGPFWGQRCRPIPVVDASAEVDRLRYVMRQGVKEGLVSSPLQWPGATSTSALISTMASAGLWVDRDLQTRAARSVRKRPFSTYASLFRIVLSPIPSWRHLPLVEVVERHREMLASVEDEGQADALGAARVASQDPHGSPPHPARRVAPLCHSSTATARTAFRDAYRAFVAAFRTATAAVRDAITAAQPVEIAMRLFPHGSYPHVAWYPTSFRSERPLSNAVRN